MRKVKETAEKAVDKMKDALIRTTPATGPSGTFALCCNRPKALRLKRHTKSITRR
jgi:hypothetical protein